MTGTGFFSQRALAFPYQCHSASPSYLCSS